MPSRTKKPYELVPKDQFYWGPNEGNSETQAVCTVDRIMVDQITVVTIIHNGGRVLAIGRETELRLV